MRHDFSRDPLGVPLGDGFDLQVVSALTRADGSISSVCLEVLNGHRLHSDAFDAANAYRRKQFVKAVADAAPGVPQVELTQALLDLPSRLRERLAVDAAAESTDDREVAEARLSADFPGLVDVVSVVSVDSVGEAGTPAFLVLTDAGPRVVPTFTPTNGPDADVPLAPPPARALPWMLPRASEVVAWIGRADDPALFADVVAAIKRHAKLPAPAEHPDAYYVLCAAWVFLTHYLEVAAYAAMIAFWAVPERGKSRAGRTLTYLARHGVRTETLREANLFRDAQDRRATLFLDVMDLWKKAERAGSEDILLLRFERGAQVSRVLYPERGPFNDTVYFDVFGPTIIATNEPMSRILDTRCVSIAMPQATDADGEYPVPDEAALLPLRERLTAWRARRLMANWRPPPMPKPAASRLGDILLPLAQIVADVAPAHLDALRDLAKHLERERRQERAMSWEGLISTAVQSLAGQVSNSLLLLELIVAHVNKGRDEKEQLSSRRVSTVLRALGFTVKKAHANKAAMVWDQEKIDAVAAQFVEHSDDQEASVSHADANHANHDETEPTASVVSVVSVDGGDSGPLLPRFFEGRDGDPVSPSDERRALLERVLEEAEVLDWPWLAEPLDVGPGVGAWDDWTDTATDLQLAEALAQLEALAASGRSEGDR